MIPIAGKPWIVAAAGLCLLLIPARACCADLENLPTCPSCNIILIGVDPLRADELGAYGNHDGLTPNLDALAARGAVFLNAFSPAPYTTPSVMSIFTSLYPEQHRVVYALAQTLDQRVPTMPQVFQEHGYRTIWAAKIGDRSHDHLSSEAGFGRGFDEFCPPEPGPRRSWSPIFKCLEENKHRKFFMFLHTWDPRAPYIPDPASALRFAKTIPRGVAVSSAALRERVLDAIFADPSIMFQKAAIERHASFFDSSTRTMSAEMSWRFISGLASDPNNAHAQLWRIAHDVFFSQFDPHNPRDLAALKSLYDAGVHDEDTKIGLLMDRLEALGIAGRTLIVFTADHGEEFMEHGELEHAKHSYYENVHVPLVVAFPNQGRGVRIPAIVSSLDIAPTLLAAAGLPPISGAQGLSLLDTIGGRSEPRRERYVFSHFKSQWVVRGDRFTYTWSRTYRELGYLKEELYDRSVDPDERKNVIREFPDDAKALREALTRHIQAVGDGEKIRWPGWVRSGVREKLMRTGYW